MLNEKWKKLSFISAVAIGLTACATEANETTEEPSDDIEEYTTTQLSDGNTEFVKIENPNGGKNLSLSASSKIELIEIEDNDKLYAFKDINGNGELDDFEDWRLDIDSRVEDLVNHLSLEQKAGLTLFSSHEKEPEQGLTDDQKTYLEEDQIRNVLNAGSNDVEDNVTWVNEMQEFVELIDDEDKVYIPINFSSDPRSTAAPGFYNAEGDISRWPSHLGLSATFNPEHTAKYAAHSSQEYRALGIGTALGPQIDVTSDPRWLRASGTFGESHLLTIDMARAYMDNSQSTFADNEDIGWGQDSINTMMKHFPGDGMGEGGRESHTDPGKYAVYPGDQFEEHVETFVESGLGLEGKTEETSSVMTSYSIGIGKDGNPILGEDKLGTSYNKEVIDILREDNNYDGVIVTDWRVTGDTAWGVDDLSLEEKHFEVIKGGTDMFGGNNDVEPVLQAHELWEKEYENGNLPISADERFDQSAKRILKMIVQVGLYEDPYLDLEHSQEVVGSQEKVEDGYQAQLDSVVLLKNDDLIEPQESSYWEDKSVYIPGTHQYEFASDFFGTPESVIHKDTLDRGAAETFFESVYTDEFILNDDDEFESLTRFEDFENVDVIIAGLDSPDNGALFTAPGKDEDGNYYPLSLMYRPYTANSDLVRKESIAGDDGENRSYYNATSQMANAADLDAFEYAVEMGEKHDIPVIAVINSNNPMVFSEVEPFVDAIVVGFNLSDQAKLEIALGLKEAKGRLPVVFPENMETVEDSFEDVSFDTEPYTDSNGNKYDFGFGLDFSGVIDTSDIEKYMKEANE